MPETEAAAPYIFVSYASADRARVLPLVAALSAAGIAVWFDREAIEGGHNYGPAISAAIAGCAVLLLACSPASLASRNVRQEVALAWKYDRPYLPVLLEAVSFPPELEYWLEGSQWLDVLQTPPAVWLPRVLRALGKLGLSPHARTPAPEAAFPHPLTPSPEAGEGEHDQSPRLPVLPSPAAGAGPGVRVSPVSEAGEPDQPPQPTVLPSPPRGGAGGEVRPLPGRAQELATLRASLERALQGHARLLLLAGEPGIGKTRLAQHLAAEAEARGARVLWGRCWEGEGAPPFWPWLQLVRDLLRQCEPETLPALLGAGAPDLAQLLPEVRTLVPDLPPLPQLDPEVARFRLFEAMVTLLRQAAAGQPLVVVLDDLHWADGPSLRLLLYLAQELSLHPEVRLLVLGTYRDVALDRTHPLAEALGGLRREAASERLLLGGLDEAGVEAFIVAFLTQTAARARGAGEEQTGNVAARVPETNEAGAAATLRSLRVRALVQAVLVETEGNPFFVQEILRHLVETGRLVQDGAGQWTSPAASIAALGLPEGLREVIGRRLSALSPDCNHLLTLASVLGREFEAESLERLSGAADDMVDAALVEAERAQVVVEVRRGSGRYRFAHALFRETLYAEVPSRRRVRLHRQAGGALEQQYARGLESHLSELAYHFAEGATGGDVERAIDYAKRAGERALASYAHEEAVRLFELGLSLLEDAEIEDPEQRCDLLLGLAAGLMQTGGQRRVVDEVAPKALALAEGLGDDGRAWRACAAVIQAATRAGVATAVLTPEYGEWLQRAERHAGDDARARLWIDILWQLRQGLLGQGGADFLARRLATLDRAAALGDVSLHCLAAGNAVLYGTPAEWAEQVRLARQEAERDWSGVGAHEYSSFVIFCSMKLLDGGDLQGAERLYAQLGQRAERTRDAYATLLVQGWQNARLERAGLLRELLAALAQFVGQTEAAGSRVFGLQSNAQSGLRPRLHLGQPGAALAALGRQYEAAGLPLSPRNHSLVLIRAHLGPVDEVTPVLDWLLTQESHIDEQDIRIVALYLEAALVAGHRAAVDRLAALLAPAAEAAACLAIGVCAARLLSAAAALLGKREEALAYAEQALVVSGRISDRPELALEHLQLAELLAEGDAGERGRAREHLDIALRELAAMEMAPALARARRLDEAVGRSGAVGNGQ